MKFMEVLMNVYLPYSFSCWRKWMYILRKWTAKGVNWFARHWQIVISFAQFRPIINFSLRLFGLAIVCLISSEAVWSHSLSNQAILQLPYKLKILKMVPLTFLTGIFKSFNSSLLDDDYYIELISLSYWDWLKELHSVFFIRTYNFGAEAERSHIFFCDLRLKTFLRCS